METGPLALRWYDVLADISPERGAGLPELFDEQTDNILMFNC